MVEYLSDHAYQEGTYVVNFSMTDESGNSIAPVTLSWSLHTKDGTIINLRTDVDINSPATSNDIVLQGDDLQILMAEESSEYVERRVTFKATYDSSLGTDLPANREIAFILENLTIIDYFIGYDFLDGKIIITS